MSERASREPSDVVDRLRRSENTRLHAWILRTLRDASPNGAQMRRVTEAWRAYKDAVSTSERAETKAHLEEIVQAIEQEQFFDLPESERVKNIGATFSEAFYVLGLKADEELIIQQGLHKTRAKVDDTINLLENQYKLACSLAGYVETLLESGNIAKAFALLIRLKRILERTEGNYRVLRQGLTANTVATFRHAVRHFDPEQNLFVFIEELEGKLEDKLAELTKK